jgi:hypothetical protein
MCGHDVRSCGLIVVAAAFLLSIIIALITPSLFRSVYFRWMIFNFDGGDCIRL